MNSTGRSVMGNIRNLITTALVAAGLGAVHAQTFNVDIKGTVLNSRSGELIAGATITLSGNTSIKATSDAQGNYVLSGQVVGLHSGAAASDAGMTMASGEIRFSLSRETPVSIEVYGLDSRR